MDQINSTLLQEHKVEGVNHFNIMKTHPLNTSYIRNCMIPSKDGYMTPSEDGYMTPSEGGYMTLNCPYVYGS